MMDMEGLKFRNNEFSKHEIILIRKQEVFFSWKSQSIKLHNFSIVFRRILSLGKEPRNLVGVISC